MCVVTFSGVTSGGMVTSGTTTLLDHTTTLAYLAYLGFDGDSRQALRILRRNRNGTTSRKSSALGARSAFLCHVFGAAGSGKSSLLRRFVGKSFVDQYTQTVKALTVANAVEVKDNEINLVMQEFGAKYEPDVLANHKKLSACDVACFVYDSSDVNSFSHVAGLIKQLDIAIPCVIVATKSDQDLVQQRYEVPPDVFCRNMGLDKPIHISVKDDSMADLYNKLASVAMYPFSAIPKDKSKPTEKFPLGRYLAITATLGAVVAVGFAAWRIYKQGEVFRRT